MNPKNKIAVTEKALYLAAQPTGKISYCIKSLQEAAVGKTLNDTNKYSGSAAWMKCTLSSEAWDRAGFAAGSHPIAQGFAVKNPLRRRDLSCVVMS